MGNSDNIMVIAGETSGDTNAAELIAAIQAHPAIQAQTRNLSFFGTGGPKMRDAGLEVVAELPSVVGISDVLSQLQRFRQAKRQLLAAAQERLPQLIILSDFSGFNLRFAKAIRERQRRFPSSANWKPNIVYYVTPQVWASRPKRARVMEQTIDLALTIFPFEKEWYASRAPNLRVEYTGHPLVERYALRGFHLPWRTNADKPAKIPPLILLLPGSRRSEIIRHLPPLYQAARQIQKEIECQFQLIFADEQLRAMAEATGAVPPAHCEVRIGGLSEALASADMAMASTGTVTLECALFALPTVTLYKTTALNYWLGKRLITVPYLTMPNILADAEVMPEFLQSAATPDNLAAAVLGILNNPERYQQTRQALAEQMDKFAGAPASQAAASIIADAYLTPRVSNPRQLS